MSNSMPLAKKSGYEFLWLPEEYGIKGRYFNPSSGCPNLWRNAEGRAEGCKTPGYEVRMKIAGEEKLATGYVFGESYCYMADKCNQFPNVHKPEYRFHEGRLEQPSHTKKPSLVAVGSDGDVFGFDANLKEIEAFVKIRRVLAVATHHFYLFLTKFLHHYSQLFFINIENYGIGATITDSRNVKNLSILQKFNAPGMKFIVIEPCFFTPEEAKGLDFTGIDWIVCGSLNVRNNALERRWYPAPETIENIYHHAKKTGCAVYFKNSLKKVWADLSAKHHSYKHVEREGLKRTDWLKIPREFPRAITEWAEKARTK